MDSQVEIFLKRSNTELLAAKSLKILSEETKHKEEFNIPQDVTFYSSVISCSYYAIFYAAKAYLLSKSIPIKSKQGQHQQVYFEFRKLVQTREIEKELLRIYEENKLKAEVLLGILKSEKVKRTDFTYETIPQANKAPAEDSLNNAITFISHIQKFLA
jgi:uncharacterized protein (UPF0332 family)